MLELRFVLNITLMISHFYQILFFMYVIPLFLMHDVHPFRKEGERRCFSFNAFVKT